VPDHVFCDFVGCFDGTRHVEKSYADAAIGGQTASRAFTDLLIADGFAGQSIGEWKSLPTGSRRDGITMLSCGVRRRRLSAHAQAMTVANRRSHTGSDPGMARPG